MLDYPPKIGLGTIGLWAREHRERRGLSREALAITAGVAIQDVEALEQGELSVVEESAARLLRELDLLIE